ncbi:MAG: prolyl oligopeptidase family serine peptidase [Betaproteobacteria bacterium]
MNTNFALNRPTAAASAVSFVWLALVLASCATPPPVETPKTIIVPVASVPEPVRKPGPPIAAIRDVSETFFGQTVVDHYRYLENVKNPEVIAYMKAQGEFARATLDAIPGRTAIEARIGALSEANVSIADVQISGTGAATRVFYYKISPGESMRRLYVRDGIGGKERLLFDAQALSSPGRRYALNYYLAAPDGKHALVGIAAGGSEETSLRIIEVATAKDLEVVIDRIGFAVESAWSEDGRAFFYNRLPAATSGDKKNRYLHSRVFRHVLGRDISKDEPIFGQGVASGTKINFADIDIPGVQMTADGRFLVGSIRHGDLNEISLYVAPASGPASIFSQRLTWRKVVDPADLVTSYAIHDGGMYLLTAKNAPRNKVVRTAVARPDFATATTIVPAGDTVIKQLAVAQDALYIRELFSGVDRLQRLNFSNSVFSGGKLEFVRLPFDLAIRQIVTHPKRPGAILRLEGWTEAPRYVNIEERTANVIALPLLPKSTVDFSNIDEVRLMVTAKDGTQVPLSLIYKKGTRLNSNNATLLRGYGAYGITLSPTFNPATLAWLERGGILGTCHVRGGGEFGDPWHKDGQKLTKPNTWRDLIACAEYLVERKFTRKEKLAIQGGSAGGITVGRAMTERPDLFAAVVPSVGVLDALRAEFTPNGPPNIPEFGSVKTADGFNSLHMMSAYHHVKDGTAYPAVLLMHGVNDPRVEVWQSSKMAARLQAATAHVRDAEPVLLRLDYDAGHGVGSTRSQRNGELADIYSFLLWKFGDPQFQPK